MSEEGFTVLAKEVAALVSAGEVEKARCKLARLASDEFVRGADVAKVAFDGLDDTAHKLLCATLAGAVICKNDVDFVTDLIKQAHEAGFTEDGQTLTEEGSAAIARAYNGSVGCRREEFARNTQIGQCIALLDSMVRCGEEHSEKSEEVMRAARALLPRGGGQ